jgi:hypothetical protein
VDPSSDSAGSRLAATPSDALRRERLPPAACAFAGWLWTATPRAALQRTPRSRADADAASEAEVSEPCQVYSNIVPVHGLSSRAEWDPKLPRIRTRWGSAKDPKVPQNGGAGDAPARSCTAASGTSDAAADQEATCNVPQSARPKYVVARGGIAFSVSPPGHRGAGVAGPFATGFRSPSAALLCLRKLRRNAHFRHLTRAVRQAELEQQAPVLPCAAAHLSAASASEHNPAPPHSGPMHSQRKCVIRKRTNAFSPRWTFQTAASMKRTDVSLPFGSTTPPKTLRWQEALQQPASQRAQRQVHVGSQPAAGHAVPPRRVRIPPSARRRQSGAEQRAARRAAKRVGDKAATPLDVALTGNADCSLAVVGQMKHLHVRPPSAQRRPPSAGACPRTSKSPRLVCVSCSAHNADAHVRSA